MLNSDVNCLSALLLHCQILLGRNATLSKLYLGAMQCFRSFIWAQCNAFETLLGGDAMLSKLY